MRHCGNISLRRMKELQRPNSYVNYGFCEDLTSRVLVSQTLMNLSNELDVNIPVSTGHHRIPVIAYSCPLFLVVRNSGGVGTVGL